MKIITWNVNGLRTLDNFRKHISLLDPDILCLQETKISRAQLDNELAKCCDFYSFFNYPLKKQGQAGVATYVKKAYCPHFVDLLADNLDSDQEGRVIASYHKKSDGKILVIVNVYVPCAYPGDGEKYEKKIKFLENLKAHVSKLIEENNDVVLAGDLNVKTRIIDSAEAFENRHNSKFIAEWHSSPDKIIFNSFLDDHLVDCLRYLYPNKPECYTCWNAGLNGRINNYGTRIDYILLSKSSKTLIKSCSIMSDITGSDHCPFSTEIDFSVLPSPTVPPECTIFYPELRGKQTSISSMFSKRKAEMMIEKKSTQLVSHPGKKQKTNSGLGATQKQCTQTKLMFSAKCSKVQKPQALPNHKRKASSPSNTATSSSAVSVKSLLRGLPTPPVCSGHQLKSSLKTVTKEGPNFGKRFYCCSLPIGPSSSKSSRCNFFQWLDK